MGFFYPSLSILAERAVTIVDRKVDRCGTRAVAQARYARQFLKIVLFTIEHAFGGWAQATRAHFADGEISDQIYTVR